MARGAWKLAYLFYAEVRPLCSVRPRLQSYLTLEKQAPPATAKGKFGLVRRIPREEEPNGGGRNGLQHMFCTWIATCHQSGSISAETVEICGQVHKIRQDQPMAGLSVHRCSPQAPQGNIQAGSKKGQRSWKMVGKVKRRLEVIYSLRPQRIGFWPSGCAVRCSQMWRGRIIKQHI